MSALLEAGAILPGAAPAERSIDAITARVYEHPALEGRTVVRLVPGTLGQAEDLSMEFLGFAAGAEPVAVGHGRRQALGFPAWALVNDPDNGRHALALVKDMERLARVAKSKPGNAKEGYDALAVRLGAAAPHFLPTYWEQAGRAFIAAENPKGAGTCFAAARLAEQVHGLPVDEDRLRDVHLEFAFAGALTAKALSEYARQVTQRRPAAEAYDLVRTIAVRRVAGGLPPYVGMADDLKRLAKAAGLTPDAEAESVIGELIGYPAVGKAHDSFWKSYRPALLRLTRRDPAARSRLLGLLPDPPGYGKGATETWLELLDEAGALDALRSPATAPAAAAPAGGVAVWTQRFLDHRSRGWGWRGRSVRWTLLFAEMVDTIRDELVASGGELRLGAENSWFAELDLLDLCLAAGVPVKGPEPGAVNRNRLQVNTWFGGSDTGRRDLAAIAADPRFLPALISGLRDYLGAKREAESGERRANALRKRATWTLEHAGLRTAARTWLATVGERVGSTPTVLTLADALDELAPLWTYDGLSLTPDMFAGLAAADPAEALARVLRGGLPSELSWPEHEATSTDVGQANEQDSWPFLVFSATARAVVLGPDGVVLDHAYRTPRDVKLHSYDKLRAGAFVDGELRVDWSSGCYWSGRPTETLGGHHGWGYGSWSGGGLPLPEGGRTTGERPLRVGDATEPHVFKVISDGEAYWRYEPTAADDNAPDWREYDPATGTPGRRSLPAFFAVDLAPGDRLRSDWSHLRPAPEAYAGSPLGWRDGLVGWRVIQHADGTFTGTGIDGRSARWAPIDDPDQYGQFVGVYRLPGDDRLRPATYGGTGGRNSGTLVTLWDVDGRQPAARWSTGPGLPAPTYLHALRPRDEAGSKALRSADASLAARLLAACADADVKDVLTSARKAVAELLGEITDRNLAEAVAWSVNVAERTRRVQRGLADLLAERPDPSGPVAAAASAAPVRLPVSESELSRVVTDLGAADGSHGRTGNGQMAEQIARVAALLTAERGTAAEMPVAATTWAWALPRLGAFVVRAASPLTPEHDRKALTGLLRILANFGHIGADTRLRVHNVTCPAALVDANGGAVLHTDTSTFVILAGPNQYYSDRDQWERTAVEFSPTGTFRVPDKVMVKSTRTFTGWGDPARLAAVVEQLDRDGVAPLPTEAFDRLAAATGISRSEAALLLAGLPRLNSWEANFLTPEERGLLGLRADTLRAARDSLRSLPAVDRLSLLDAAMPADPADLWRTGPDVDGVARRWVELFGVATPVSDELLAEANRMLDRDGADTVRVLARPTPGDWLHTDGVSKAEGWSVTTKAPSGTPFNDSHLRVAATALPWLAYRLPAGDPVRASLPKAYRLVRERLGNEKLLVGAAHLERAMVPPGMAALVEGQHWETYANYYLRPAALSGVDDPALAFMDGGLGACVRLVLGEQFAATMAAIESESLPAGRFAQDPTVSVPDLVGAVAAEYQLDADAAAYYLQLLALPDPTDKRVAEWNGWKPARLTAARKALLGTDLVVEAKRERAGRSVFLPGGWLALKAPDLPIEAWKTGLGADGSLPGGRVLVTSTVPELFRASWARVVAGDLPRYHSLSETR
ncbi:hypothetical protein GCM10009682_21840 [Luedemannella flava]|uniref:DNA-binding protein n=1 Tax=Luedemannella flava TaxID=349316 RepID=A0ABP4Y6V8_9ACTN